MSAAPFGQWIHAWSSEGYGIKPFLTATQTLGVTHQVESVCRCPQCIKKLSLGCSVLLLTEMCLFKLLKVSFKGGGHLHLPDYSFPVNSGAHEKLLANFSQMKRAFSQPLLHLISFASFCLGNCLWIPCSGCLPDPFPYFLFSTKLSAVNGKHSLFNCCWIYTYSHCPWGGQLLWHCFEWCHVNGNLWRYDFHTSLPFLLLFCHYQVQLFGFSALPLRQIRTCSSPSAVHRGHPKVLSPSAGVCYGTAPEADQVTLPQ